MTASQAATATDPWAQAHWPVVVAVDGSDGSSAALAWAAHEAASAGAELRVVTTVERYHSRTRAARYVEAVAHLAHQTVAPEQVATAVYDGRPEHVLLHHLDDCRLLVVGKRGLGAIPRLLVGSTSVAVASRAPVPVAVVPTGWEPEAHVAQPVVVGLDPDEAHHRLLHLAFRKAERHHVSLVLIHGSESHDPEGVEERFGVEVALWQARFPAIEVRSELSPSHPAMALLAEAERGAQMLVLGRRDSHRFSGFGFGSVTRAVLHYAEVPVLVVPLDDL